MWKREISAECGVYHIFSKKNLFTIWNIRNKKMYFYDYKKVRKK